MESSSHKSKKTSRIFIVEDHPIFRSGLTALIEQEDDLSVCGSAEDVDGAVRAVEELKPDLVIVDLSLKTSNGFNLLQQIKSEHGHLPVLVLSTYDEQIYAERCLHAGALGYINKKEASELVIKAVRHIFKGNIFLSEKMTAAVLNKLQGKTENLSTPSVKKLTNRELEVFSLIGRGMVSAAIADHLCISAKTVYSHTERIKEKLGIKNSSELVRFAVLWVESETHRNSLFSDK